MHSHDPGSLIKPLGSSIYCLDTERLFVMKLTTASGIYRLDI
jgi:hypothetical protein